jgi:hypothetical protein
MQVHLGTSLQQLSNSTGHKDSRGTVYATPTNRRDRDERNKLIVDDAEHKNGEDRWQEIFANISGGNRHSRGQNAVVPAPDHLNRKSAFLRHARKRMRARRTGWP